MFRALLFVSLFCFHLCTYAHSAFDSFNRSLKLGEVNLSVSSTNSAAKGHFQLGLKFLHAFMYELAREQFQLAEKHEPSFIMAYWGEAMTHKQSIWNIESLSDAQVVLDRMPKETSSLTDVERGLKNAAFVLFKPGSSLQERDRQYITTLQTLSKQHPKEVDVNSFYALSLMQYAADFPLASENKANIKKARQILDKLFKQHPKHVGVMHYLIHAYDSPDKIIALHALPAADKALKEISSSSHITHMSAHIYRRLARWQDYIDANETSVKAAESLCYQWAKLKNDEKALKNLEVCNADNKYHSLEWLQYGYLLTGQKDKAKKVFNRTQETALKTNLIAFKQWYYRLFARQVLMGEDYKQPIIPIDPISEQGSLYWSVYSECGAHFANGVLAIKQKKPTVFLDSQQRLSQLVKLSQPLGVPFITKTCEKHLMGLKTIAAWDNKDKVLATQYLKKMRSIEINNPSTEVTPSLVFITVDEFKERLSDSRLKFK